MLFARNQSNAFKPMKSWYSCVYKMTLTQLLCDQWCFTFQAFRSAKSTFSQRPAPTCCSCEANKMHENQWSITILGYTSDICTALMPSTIFQISGVSQCQNRPLVNEWLQHAVRTKLKTCIQTHEIWPFFRIQDDASAALMRSMMLQISVFRNANSTFCQ